MKSTAEYVNILSDYMAKNASKYSIIRMGIFGSVARGEQTEDSDVDVYLETSKPNMFALVHIKEDLQNLFGCNVDIVRLRDQMDSFLKNRIEKEGIYVWYRVNPFFFNENTDSFRQNIKEVGNDTYSRWFLNNT